jgi:hypothetical protein
MVKPLWLKTNTTLYSSPFNVPSGQTALLFAVGFGRSKKRTSATEVQVAQCAVLHRLLFDYEVNKDPAPACGGVLDLKKIKATTIVDDVVCQCGHEWAGFNMGNNLALLGLPGNYQFVFNSEEMIGKAQIYLELYDNNNLPVQALCGLYF